MYLFMYIHTHKQTLTYVTAGVKCKRWQRQSQQTASAIIDK